MRHNTAINDAISAAKILKLFRMTKRIYKTYQSYGKFDTFFQFPFVEWEKGIRFAKKFDCYGNVSRGHCRGN